MERIKWRFIMFTICTGKQEINSQINSISGITEKISLEKRRSDDFDKVITGEMKGNKEDFINVIDFDLLDCFRDEEKIIICGKDFRRLFFPKYKIFSSENGTLICKKGICVTILTLFFFGMFAKFASLLFAIHDFHISVPIYAILAVVIFLFFYNFKKSKEEMNEIDMLLIKVIE
ncbi:hypothetical protein [Treponema sp. C6A8]|uniref:hypothetical protein n=1 Tax=Treponema sp. C6A8 TaxID=1410609 RepID=UPI0012DC5F8F|nr:hypothetical protein [Treponema sp. C6A8]